MNTSHRYSQHQRLSCELAAAVMLQSRDQALAGHLYLAACCHATTAPDDSGCTCTNQSHITRVYLITQPLLQMTQVVPVQTNHTLLRYISSFSHCSSAPDDSGCTCTNQSHIAQVYLVTQPLLQVTQVVPV